MAFSGVFPNSGTACGCGSGGWFGWSSRLRLSGASALPAMATAAQNKCSSGFFLGSGDGYGLGSGEETGRKGWPSPLIGQSLVMAMVLRLLAASAGSDIPSGGVGVATTALLRTLFPSLCHLLGDMFADIAEVGEERCMVSAMPSKAFTEGTCCRFQVHGWCWSVPAFWRMELEAPRTGELGDNPRPTSHSDDALVACDGSLNRFTKQLDCDGVLSDPGKIRPELRRWRMEVVVVWSV